MTLVARPWESMLKLKKNVRKWAKNQESAFLAKKQKLSAHF